MGQSLFRTSFQRLDFGTDSVDKETQMARSFCLQGRVGNASDRNNGSLPDTGAILLFPEGMTSVDKPYVEMGFGIENIFRLFRVDCIWRLTHRDSLPGQDVQNFAVNMSLRLKF